MKDNPFVYIFGHKSPDTDSICSAIAYADLKQQLGINAKPIRLGKINQETAFVLDYFNLPVPDFLPTIRTQISDLDIDEVSPLFPKLSLKTAWDKMKKTNIKVAPVVDETMKLLGLVSLSDITSRFMDIADSAEGLKATPLKNILKTLDAYLLCGSADKLKTTGRALIAAMTPDGMAPFVRKGDIVLLGNRRDSQIKSIGEGANCIVVTCDGHVDPDVIELAEAYDCVMIRTEYDTFTAAILLTQSIPVEFVMETENLLTFRINDYIDEVREQMLESRHRAYPVLDSDNRIRGFISRYHLISEANRKKVILVDHNELSQSIDGLEQAQILEIIDHHRIGGISTGNPVFFRNVPVGSTATIISGIYDENGIKPSPQIAGILCAAILSDTMYFKSPTCTKTDIGTASRLAEIADIDIKHFGNKMLESSSSLLGMSPGDILNYDFKEFFLNKHKVGIGQVTSSRKGELDSVKTNILEYLNHILEQKDYHIVLLVVSDPSREGSDILFAEKEQGIVDKAFDTKSHNNTMFLKGVVSRKKQIVPQLNSVLQY